MITIKDVAKHSGVSISLVSKAINGYTDINEQTKQKILDSIEELGYVPNSSASSLSKKKKDKIAIIVRGYKGKSKDLYLDEISMIYSTTTFNESIKNNIDVMIIYDDIFDGKNSSQIHNYLKSQGITGIIMFGLNKNEDELYSIYKTPDFKKVILDIPIFNESTSGICIDDVKAQIKLLDNTIDKSNTKHVLYVKGPDEDITSSQRYLGARYFFEHNKITFDSIDCGYELQKTFEELQNIDLKIYDAIICANDMMAIGASKAIDKNNLDILVTGFDGINALKLLNRNIPTIDQNFHNKARLAVNELIRILKGGQTRVIVDDYTFVPVTPEITE